MGGPVRGARARPSSGWPAPVRSSCTPEREDAAAPAGQPRIVADRAATSRRPCSPRRRATPRPSSGRGSRASSPRPKAGSPRRAPGSPTRRSWRRRPGGRRRRPRARGRARRAGRAAPRSARRLTSRAGRRQVGAVYGSARDPRRPGWSANRHDQPRRSGRCLPARRADRRRRRATGFFARDTRFISGYDFSINGVRPTLLNSSAVEFFSSRFEFTNPDLIDEDGSIPRHTVSICASTGRCRRRARGLRRHQLRAPPDPADPRDLDHVGLRRHLRRQGARASCGVARSTPVVARAPLAADDLSQPDVPARPPHRRSTRPTRGRSSPTAGSSSWRRSSPRASGTPACAGSR